MNKSSSSGEQRVRIQGPDHDTSLVFDVRGCGRAALYVHGWSCSRTDIAAVADLLAPSNRVYAVDLPHHGASSSTISKWTMAGLGEVVAAVVRRLGLRDVALIGHSMGAAVVVEAAALLGSDVRRVIALDGLSYLNVYPRQDEASVDGFVSPFVANFREAINHFVNNAMPGSDETLKRHVATVMKSGPSQHRVPMLAELLRWDMDSALDRLVAPISVLAARQFLSAELEIRYGKRFETIPTDLGGHFFFMEQPSASAEMLDSLLRR